MSKKNVFLVLLGVVVGVLFGACGSWVFMRSPRTAEEERAGAGDVHSRDAFLSEAAWKASREEGTRTSPADVESESETLAAVLPQEQHGNTEHAPVFETDASRLDQVKAIELLKNAGTLEATELLLEAFLSSTDPVLTAMLQEALLASEFEIAPSVMAAFQESSDPRELGQLAGLLTRLVDERPELEADVVDLFIESLENPGPDGERLKVIPGALRSLGLGALEAVAAFLADPTTDTRGAQTAAWVLTQLDEEHGERVREKVSESCAALLETIRDPELSEAERESVRAKTQSLAWSAANRPPPEHDPLGNVLAEGLTESTDPEQAQSLAWGVANLRGLSDSVRQDLAQSILGSLAKKKDGEIRQSFVWAVNHLALADGKRPLDENFYRILTMTESSLNTYQHDPNIAVHLHWLLSTLRAHEKKKRSG